MGKIIGGIYVENRSVRARFKEKDVNPLILFANQAAVAIDNAHLYGVLEQRVRELNSYNEVQKLYSGNKFNNFKKDNVDRYAIKIAKQLLAKGIINA